MRPAVSITLSWAGVLVLLAPFYICVEFPKERHVLEGLAYERQGRHGLAALEFDKAIDIAPHYAPAYLNRAVSRRGAGDEAGARRDFKVWDSLHWRSGDNFSEQMFLLYWKKKDWDWDIAAYNEELRRNFAVTRFGLFKPFPAYESPQQNHR